MDYIQPFILVLGTSFVMIGLIVVVLVYIHFYYLEEEDGMTKCPHCKSCLKDIWILPKFYRYCELCQVAFTISSEGLTEVEDYDILDQIKKMYGVRIS